ncbi:putative membrane protein YphA (DoxX/SURF4 family) [Actinoplanes campanulatus]|uniref:Putative membrane protein YphA (DoxX/SURF4 family) n=1 Tax=Actinoplanes campanulatus TaxID=113559 RepID=A0A7W5AJL4_9ACTN|nr:hypothetical protein [Actinoplanes campanulatus]MBB3097265.1 putative membrane protein YphA (DoxX/SURF4 family) [Actinoplanes campanulatus]
MTVTEKVDMVGPARAAIGLISLVLGGFWLVMSPNGGDLTDAFMGAVVAAGGLVLLLWHRLGLSGRLVSVAAGAAGVTGTLAGLTVYASGICCMFSFGESRGWPLTWLGRGAVADTSDEAIRLARLESWGVYPTDLLIDLVVWAYAGMVLAVLIGLVVRAIRSR